MAENLSEKIRNLEARINRAKTAGLRSSSSITTVSKVLTIPMLIVPYAVNYQWDHCAGKYSSRINIEWSDVVGLCAAYIKSPIVLQGRRYNLCRLTDSSHGCQYGFELISGSDADLEIFNNGGSIPEYPVEIEIVATANFSLTYTLRQEH